MMRLAAYPVDGPGGGATRPTASSGPFPEWSNLPCGKAVSPVHLSTSRGREEEGPGAANAGLTVPARTGYAPRP